MQKRARVTAIGVAVLALVGLLGWWASTERRGTSATPGGTAADMLAAEILRNGGDASVSALDSSSGTAIDGVTALGHDGTNLSADGGMFATEQPPTDYTGEVGDEMPFEPEVRVPVVGPDVVQLSEAQLTERRQGQVTVIEQRIEDLAARIDRARDQGNESMVNMLEARRTRLQTRRDTLAGM